MQGFKATFRKPDITPDEHREAIESIEPPFQLLTVSDLLATSQLNAYEGAGGERW